MLTEAERMANSISKEDLEWIIKRADEGGNSEMVKNAKEALKLKPD